MHFNIPVFIPHLGCPFQCIYCNQKYISGTIKAPDVEEVHAIIRQKLSTIDSAIATVEVAFFGGSFTCLSKTEQEKYLQAVQPYISDKKVNGIRISTRPDYINESILGHSFLNRGFKASYQVGNDVFSIFIIESNSADDARKTAETYIASTGISPVETADNKFVLTDGYNGSIFLAWKDRKIVIISGLAKDQSDIADRYTSEILK